MKLIQEYTIKLIIMINFFVITLEICVLLFISKTSTKIFDNMYEETLNKTEEKTLEITSSIKMFTTNFIIKFITNLKLIAKHTLLYNGKNTSNINDIINKNSKFVINNNQHKKIIKSDMIQLFMTPEFYKIYKETDQLNELGYPTETSYLNYIQYYSKIIGNETDLNILLKKLFKEHDELNYISHHYFGNNESYNINLDKEKSNYIKNILVILKTIYIKELIKKKSGMDIIRFFILNKEDMFIYPAEDYRKINLINFRTVYLDTSCKFDETDLSDYPSCIYDYMINTLFPEATSYALILRESVVYQIVNGAICIRFPFYKDEPDKSAICLELDLSYIVNSINVNNSKTFEFGLTVLINLPQMGFRDIFIIFDNHKEFYSELFETFNSYETTPPLYVLNYSDTTKVLKYFSLYHFMYFNITKTIKQFPELNINISRLEEEYNYVRDKIFEIEHEYKTGEKKEAYPFLFNRTTCRKQLLGIKYECFTDESKMVIMPLIMNINDLNEDFIETEKVGNDHFALFIFSIISTNPNSNSYTINTILKIKILRITCFYLFFTVVFFCFFILLINSFSEYSFDLIDNIINEIDNIEIDNKNREIKSIKENKNFTPNDEIKNLKDIYNMMRNALIIKNVFSKESYLKEHHLEFYKMIQNIKKKKVKEICNSFLAHFHFSNKIYNISENEFKSTINFIQENENKLKIGETNEYDDKLKDSIKRSSTVSYLNEYSKFDNIDENMLDIIYLKIFKQRFIYLYAMTKFKLGNEINSGNNKNKNKKNKEKKIKYFMDAIKYFQECRDINALLGINQIKIIYSLIMISKCYEKLKDYKSAIININEALSLYFKFSKTFKENNLKHYNPKAMLFIESNIYHNILYTFSQICSEFNKPSASNWIILKIFETSPFLLSNIHHQAGITLFNFFEKNKTKMNKYDQNFYKNSIILKEFDIIKKLYGKIISRLYSKKVNYKYKTSSTKKLVDSNYTTSNKTLTVTESVTDISKASSNLKKEMTTSKVSTALQNRNKRLNKIITICLSERILEKINGQELKDVLIKYFQKYFIPNENDKFSFIQFASNGKKNVFIKLETLNNFLLKLQKIKTSFKLIDSFNPNKNFQFTEFYSLLDTIIKTYPHTEETDNIIMILMESKDIRFSTEFECLNIVDDLNKKNASVYFFCFEKKIKEEKVNNIQSFLNGLIEGYFFHIKNYQQLKQIFVNISSVKSQSNFFGFDYNIFEVTL